LGRRLEARWPATAPRPVGRRLVIVLGVVLAVVPLAAVALVQPIATPAKAIAVDTIVTPVDKRIHVSVKPDGEARIVTWSHPPGGASDSFYRRSHTGRHSHD